MKRFLALLALLVPVSLHAANALTSPSSIRLVPTFNCCSIYATYTGDDNTNSVAAVRYRVTGSGNTWKNGLACWVDNATKSFKGSIVYLTSNTSYDIALDFTDSDGVSGATSLTNTVTTWNEAPQVGSSAGWSANQTNNSGTTITTYGTGVNAMRQYGPSGSSRMNFTTQQGNQSVALGVNADNILIQNIDFIGGGGHNTILVYGGHTNIWIRNCTFTAWGYPASFTSDSNAEAIGHDQDGYACICFGGQGTGGGVYRTVVENCTINGPNGSAEGWNVTGSHPGGPHGIFYYYGYPGQHVCRYNWVHGSGANNGSGHWYNDAIGGAQNESTSGATGADSDIYGNVLSEVCDDAIESDGGNRNVRIFGNVITNAHTTISTAANNVGPSYIFRNLSHDKTDQSGNQGVFLKKGISTGGANGGAEFIFNNTEDNPNPSFNSTDVSGGGNIYEIRHRNNVYRTSGGSSIKDTTASWTSSYDYDLTTGNSTLPPAPGNEPNGITGTALYTNGTYYPTTTSAAYRAGTNLQNFTMDASLSPISNPNRGAFDERFYPLLLGPQNQDPVITGQPSPQTVLNGQSATFTVTASGNTTLHYQWTFNGSNVGTDSSSYTRANCQPSDSGKNAAVTVSDVAGSATSLPALLTVTTDPSISIQPVSQSVAAGQSATFTVTAVGGSTLHYQWTFKGSNVGSDSSAYTRVNCQVADSGGSVVVNVSDANGNLNSSPATLTVTAVGGNIYYVSPTGSSTNSGLSTNAPWPLVYALANAGTSNTIMVMDGHYTPATAAPVIGSYITIKAINKWKAVLTNITGHASMWVDTTNLGITIDGLAFHHNQYSFEFISPHGVLKNLWCNQTGVGYTPGSFASGVDGGGNGWNSVVVDSCLMESNGVWAGAGLTHSHGIYGGGTNCIYRNNVLRYNSGYGLIVDCHVAAGDVNNQAYNNLIYGNFGGGSYGEQAGFYNDAAVPPHSGVGTNYFFGNIVYSTNSTAVFCQDGTVYLTNNILISTNYGVYAFGSTYPSDVIRGDYNLAPQALAYASGPHDIISAVNNFANRTHGIYWLASGAPAIGQALSGVFGAVNFFGVSQGSVADIGAFQYSGTLESDPRTLDPSYLAPSGLPDYWNTISQVPPPTITVQPTNLTAVCASSAAFYLTASGTSPVYQWYKNGSAIGGATFHNYTNASTVGGDDSAAYTCVVTNTGGSVTSSVATLSVELITTQPTNKTVTIGANAVFTVGVSSCVTNRQWYLGAVPIPGETGLTYTKVNCQPADNLSGYRCLVIAPGKQEVSASGVLYVTGIPGSNKGQGKHKGHGNVTGE